MGDSVSCDREAVLARSLPLFTFGVTRPREGESLISGLIQSQRQRQETQGVLTPTLRLLPRCPVRELGSSVRAGAWLQCESWGLLEASGTPLQLTNARL